MLITRMLLCGCLGLSCLPMLGFGATTGTYSGMLMWIFPVLLLLHPELAESMIEYRYQRLDAARHASCM